MFKLEKQKGAANLIWIIIIVVVVILLAWWMFGGDGKKDVADENSTDIQDEETAGIATDLEGLDTIDLESEFADIEADLEQL